MTRQNITGFVELGREPWQHNLAFKKRSIMDRSQRVVQDGYFMVVFVEYNMVQFLKFYV